MGGISASRRASLRRAGGPACLVAFPVAFNLWTLRAQLTRVAYVNDMTTHSALVTFVEHRIREGANPFDAWYPQLGLGSAFLRQYQVLPHVLTALFQIVTGTHDASRWILYFGLALWPVAVYASARLFTFDRWTAGCAALLSPLVASAAFSGYERSSYVWRGYGLWTQLWGMWLLPFALALTWRAIRGDGYRLAAPVVLAATVACHFLTGYLAVLAVGLWVLLVPRQIAGRGWRALMVGAGAGLLAISFIVPLLIDARWTRVPTSIRDTYQHRSFGAEQVLRWLFTGDLFDVQRIPVLSVLVAIGVVVAVAWWRDHEEVRAVTCFGLASLLMFFGPRTFGTAIEALPGGEDLLFHRFVIGVHLAGIYLAGIGAAWLGRAIVRGAHRWDVVDRRRAALVALGPIVLGVALLPGWRQIWDVDSLDRELIDTQRTAEARVSADLTALATGIRALGPGTIDAGDVGAFQRDVGAAHLSHLLLDRGFDLASGSTAASLLTDVLPVIDVEDQRQLQLFGIRYLALARDDPEPSTFATPVGTYGDFRLYTVDGAGYFDVVDTVGPAIHADRTSMADEPVALVRSSSLDPRRLPTIAFDGERAPKPSLPAGATAEGSPGTVLDVRARPADGRFAATVDASRPAVVLLKQSYQPRWQATVDGRPVRTQIVAPGMIGVPVTAGRHRVVLHYQQYGGYRWLWGVSAGTLLALLVGAWRREQRRRSP